MTKIAIICDQHWGVRGDAVAFIENRVKFLREVFFPIIDQEKVEVVLDAGDLTDRRKGITYKTAQTLRQKFLEPMTKRGLYGHFIVGNHDVTHKGSNDTNALKELVDNRYPNIEVYQDPYEIVIDRKQFLLLPWICEGNQEKSMQAIATSKSDIVLAHLEMAGFRHYKNTPVATHGMDAGLFSRFDAVWSGHYHEGSQKGNFRYLGAAGQYTWSDANCDRGFHIYDTGTNELDFYLNPFSMFEEIRYNDRNSYVDFSDQCDVAGKILRIVVENRGKAADFDAFLKGLEDAGAEDVTIVDQPPSATKAEVQSVSMGDGDDLLDLIKNVATDPKNKVDNDPVFELLESVYHEATTNS